MNFRYANGKKSHFEPGDYIVENFRIMVVVSTPEQNSDGYYRIRLLIPTKRNSIVSERYIDNNQIIIYKASLQILLKTQYDKKFEEEYPPERIRDAILLDALETL